MSDQLSEVDTMHVMTNEEAIWIVGQWPQKKATEHPLFSNALARVHHLAMKYERKVANPDYEAAADAVWIDRWNDENGNEATWKRPFIKAVVNAALGIDSEDT